MSMGVSFSVNENVLEIDDGEGVQLCKCIKCH